MIANFFNKTKPAGIILIIGLLFVYYVFATFYLKLSEFSGVFLINRLLLFGLFMLWLLIFNFITSKNRLTLDNSYGLLLGVILLGTFYETLVSTSLLLSNIFLLLAFRKIYSLRSVLSTKIKIFDAGFWIGIATLIYFGSFLFFILIYIGIILYKKLSVRNLIIPIVGFVVPLFLYFTYCFYFNKLPNFYEKFNYNFSLDYSNYQWLKLAIPLVVLFIVLFWSIIKITPNLIMMSTKFKQTWILLLNHLVVSIIVAGLAVVKNGAEMLFLVFPAGIIIANFIPKLKSSIVRNTLIYLFLAISISVYFL